MRPQRAATLAWAEMQSGNPQTGSWLLWAGLGLLVDVTITLCSHLFPPFIWEEGDRRLFRKLTAPPKKGRSDLAVRRYC